VWGGLFRYNYSGREGIPGDPKTFPFPAPLNRLFLPYATPRPGGGGLLDRSKSLPPPRGCLLSRQKRPSPKSDCSTNFTPKPRGARKLYVSTGFRRCCTRNQAVLRREEGPSNLGHEPRHRGVLRRAEGRLPRLQRLENPLGPDILTPSPSGHPPPERGRDCRVVGALNASLLGLETVETMNGCFCPPGCSARGRTRLGTLLGPTQSHCLYFWCPPPSTKAPLGRFIYDPSSRKKRVLFRAACETITSGKRRGFCLHSMGALSRPL